MHSFLCCRLLHFVRRPTHKKKDGICPVLKSSLPICNYAAFDESRSVLTLLCTLMTLCA